MYRKSVWLCVKVGQCEMNFHVVMWTQSQKNKRVGYKGCQTMYGKSVWLRVNTRWTSMLWCGLNARRIRGCVIRVVKRCTGSLCDCVWRRVNTRWTSMLWCGLKVVSVVILIWHFPRIHSGVTWNISFHSVIYFVGKSTQLLKNFSWVFWMFVWLSVGHCTLYSSSPTANSSRSGSSVKMLIINLILIMMHAYMCVCVVHSSGKHVSSLVPGHSVLTQSLGTRLKY